MLQNQSSNKVEDKDLKFSFKIKIFMTRGKNNHPKVSFSPTIVKAHDEVSNSGSGFPPLKSGYNWEGDEGLDVDINSTAFAFLNPKRGAHVKIFAEASPFYLGGERFSHCSFLCIRQLPWWLLPILKLVIVTGLLIGLSLLVLYLLNPENGYQQMSFIPGDYRLWKDRVFPIVIYIEICVVVWILGRLFYRIFLRYTHYYIMHVPSLSFVEKNPLWNRIFSSSKFQIFVASSHVIFFTIYTVLLLLLYGTCFSVPDCLDSNEDWLSTDNLVFFGYKTLVIFIAGCLLYSVQKCFIAKIIGDFYQTAYSDRLKDYYFSYQAMKRLYEHAVNEQDSSHSVCKSEFKLRQLYFKDHSFHSGLEKEYSIKPIYIPSSYIQIHYMLVNTSDNDQFVESRSQAKKAAKVIYEHFYPGDQVMSTTPLSPVSLRLKAHQKRPSIVEHRPVISPTSCLKREHLECCFTDADFPKAFRLFDIHNSGTIHPLDMKISLIALNLERSHLLKSLRDHGKAVTKLDTFSLVASGVLTMVLAPTLLGYPVKGLESIVAFLLSCKFMFSESLSHLLQSVIFLFVTHPFDVGDRVFINNEMMFVHEMGLFCTLFHRFDSHLIYYPNSVLHDQHIVNIRRAGNMTEWIDLCIDLNTPSEKIDLLNERLAGFVLAENRDFETESDHLIAHKPNGCKEDTISHRGRSQQRTHQIIEIKGWEIVDCRLLRLGIALRHKSNFQDGASRASRHFKFMTALQEALVDLNITYYPLTRRFQPL